MIKKITNPKILKSLEAIKKIHDERKKAKPLDLLKLNEFRIRRTAI